MKNSLFIIILINFLFLSFISCARSISVSNTAKSEVSIRIINDSILYSWKTFPKQNLILEITNNTHKSKLILIDFKSFCVANHSKPYPYSYTQLKNLENNIIHPYLEISSLSGEYIWGAFNSKVGEIGKIKRDLPSIKKYFSDNLIEIPAYQSVYDTMQLQLPLVELGSVPFLKEGKVFNNAYNFYDLIPPVDEYNIKLKYYLKKELLYDMIGRDDLEKICNGKPLFEGFVESNTIILKSLETSIDNEEKQ